jgi:uncharacterized membrane protein
MTHSTKVGAILAGVMVVLIVAICIVLVLDSYKIRRLTSTRLGYDPPKAGTIGLIIFAVILIGAILVFGIWSTYKRYKMADSLLKAGNTVGAAAMFAPEILGSLGMNRGGYHP